MNRRRGWQARVAPWAVAVAAWASPVGHARADEPPPPPPPALVPPRAVGAARVPYPEGGSGDAVVVLELLIDKEGAVAQASVIDGPEPFAAAALAAAPSWTFLPARRGDVAAQARIRMRVEFHEPPRAPPAPSGPPPPEPPKPAGQGRAEDVEDVTVTGQRLELAGTSMGGGEVRQMPGAFGDAFRAIDAMPGVVPIVSGLPYYFIRGAPPGNTGYMIDGVRVPLLFHFGVARSVIHPGLIDRVDFYPGAFPAKYGRFTGAIIDGQTKATAGQFHGEWDASLIHAGALVEAPFGGGRGDVTVAGRYGYPGLLLSLLAPQVFLQYGDYQTRLSWKLGDKDTISAFIFGSVDAAGTRENGELKDVVSTQFHRADLRWDHDLGGAGRIRTALTLGFDQTSDGHSFAVRDWMSGLRTELDYRLSSTVRVRAGADLLFDRYTLVASDSSTVGTFPTRSDLVMSMWADLVLKVSPAVEIVPGLRIDRFASQTEGLDTTTSAAVFSVDPRLAVRTRLFSGVDHAGQRPDVPSPVTWVSAFGITHQPPSFLVPVPGVQLGQLGKGLQTAVQMSQGFEIALPAEFTLAPTAFLHDYLNLSDATATCPIDGSTSGINDNQNDCLDQRVRGRTFGLEILLRRPFTKRLTGWFSYTLSRSTREAHPFASPQQLQNVLGIAASQQPQTVLSEFDRTHVLNVAGAYDLGANWRAGARLVYYTGRPYSNRIQGVAVPPYNTERLPSYVRLDARIEKRWLTKTGYVAFVAEGLNVTASKEVLDVNCTPASPPSLKYDTCVPNTSGAIPVVVPNLGLEGAF